MQLTATAGTIRKQGLGMQIEFSDGREESEAWAGQVLDLLRRLRVAAHPNNYLVGYIYVTERLPELRREMDQMINSGRLTENVMGDLYLRHLRPDAELRAAGVRLEETMSRLGQQIQDVNQGAEHYGQALEDFSDRMVTVAAEAATADKVEAAVGTVVDETRAMAEINCQLEDRLRLSAKEIASLRQHLEVVTRQATTDGLTGLLNRRTFDARLRQAATEAQDEATFLTLLMIDIDHFKKFNDAHGHQMGDQVLKLVAKCLTDGIKGADAAARYGGEEFAVILPRAPLSEGLQVAERLRRTVHGKKITNRRTGESLGQITLSIGVGQYVPGEDPAAVLRRADEALYAAKRGGRNRVMAQDMGNSPG